MASAHGGMSADSMGLVARRTLHIPVVLRTSRADRDWLQALLKVSIIACVLTNSMALSSAASTGSLQVTQGQYQEGAVASTDQ